MVIEGTIEGAIEGVIYLYKGVIDETTRTMYKSHWGYVATKNKEFIATINDP